MPWGLARAGSVDEALGTPPGTLSLIGAYWASLVLGSILHLQQGSQVAAQILAFEACLRQLCNRLVVILALDEIAEDTTTDRVGRRDAGVYAKRDERIAALGLIVGEVAKRFGGTKELLRLSQAPSDGPLVALTYAGRHHARLRRLIELRKRRRDP
jgi:hypothetical protein